MYLKISVNYTVVIHHPLPVRCCHLSPPSPVQQYLIVVSSLSIVHHIVFIVVIMLHVVIVASSSRPPSYWLDRIVHSPTLVGFCLSDKVIAVGQSSARRQTTGAHRPQLAVVAVRHSLSSLLTAHAHRHPRAFESIPCTV